MTDISIATKAQFITLLRDEIIARYPWAADATKLERFMDAVKETFQTDRNRVSLSGEAFIAVWRRLGGKGKPTYKALRALRGDTGEMAS